MGFRRPLVRIQSLGPRVSPYGTYPFSIIKRGRWKRKGTSRDCRIRPRSARAEPDPFPSRRRIYAIRKDTAERSPRCLFRRIQPISATGYPRRPRSLSPAPPRSESAEPCRICLPQRGAPADGRGRRGSAPYQGAAASLFRRDEFMLPGRFPGRRRSRRRPPETAPASGTASEDRRACSDARSCRRPWTYPRPPRRHWPSWQ